MLSSFFYLHVEKNDVNNKILSMCEEYAEKNKKQIYIIDRPLGDTRYNYKYTKALILLSPDYKIVFINLNTQDTDDFDDFVDDFIDDLGSISDKYRYKEQIGRPRKWRDALTVTYNAKDISNCNDFFEQILLTSPEDKKKSELLISLLTGSINDIDKTGIEVPDNVLDKIKQQVLLFDGDQTRFIYQQPTQKVIRIQGLSGTGKTELLLHKIKELYIDDDNTDSKILFTCHNKILAASLNKRIPDFFNFMKVEKQILWNDRLWCVGAWGSRYDKNSGAYAYICNFYNAPFHRYSYNTSFDYACNKTIEYLNKNNSIKEKGFAFDYILLDESQDFPDSFIHLCSMITKNNLYVAGDIFQSIFDENIVNSIEPDYLLTKCYRTDPRTLMFAHALGMGLFENSKLRWLEDKEWLACGYITEIKNDFYHLSREPLRKFIDIVDKDHSSVEIVRTSANKFEVSETKIIDLIKTIKIENPTVTVNDIGIIFIDNKDYVYSTADNLFFSIKTEFGWDVNKAYETKTKIKDTLFVSNKNNVKGLEFPFVICVTKKIDSNQSYRNALYMMLTRSFLKSYLLINEESNEGLLPIIESGLNEINKTGSLIVKKPSKEEMQRIKTTIKYTEIKKSFYELVYEMFDEINVDEKYRNKLFEIVKNIADDDFDYDRIHKAIRINLELLN
ncbi:MULTISPECIES: DEAD/DEAH box helicase [Providencia]|uniref:DEAD/DEAH box helicase n=1 Tax=Providencia TaxID=586 RepID=UPI00065DF786|nr:MULTISPECIES: UvrD-helicase domain-containing protein [Providencia]